MKTPVFTLGVRGARNGMCNLDHALRVSAGDEDGIGDVGPMHAVVVRRGDFQDYVSVWGDKILMVLPGEFDDLGAGS